MAKAVKNTVGGYYRPDLVKSALARWTKYHRSLLVIKAKKVCFLANDGDSSCDCSLYLVPETSDVRILMLTH